MIAKLRALALKIAKIRILDGYTGLLGLILHYRIFALYHSTIELFCLSLRAGKHSLFYIGWNYNTHNRKNASWTTYPPFTIRLTLLNWHILDTGAQAAKDTHEQVERFMEKRKQEEAEKERLIGKAKELGL